jgi:hypothetical protein
MGERGFISKIGQLWANLGNDGDPGLKPLGLAFARRGRNFLEGARLSKSASGDAQLLGCGGSLAFLGREMQEKCSGFVWGSRANVHPPLRWLRPCRSSSCPSREPLPEGEEVVVGGHEGFAGALGYCGEGRRLKPPVRGGDQSMVVIWGLRRFLQIPEDSGV